MEHDEFMYREEDEEPEQIQELIDAGYLSIIDNGQKYLYNPKHWDIVLDDGIYDYMFDDLAFRAKSDKARELAKSEGF